MRRLALAVVVVLALPAVASVVAREAHLDGTLVALVGTRLAAVSEHVPPERLDELGRGRRGWAAARGRSPRP